MHMCHCFDQLLLLTVHMCGVNSFVCHWQGTFDPSVSSCLYALTILQVKQEPSRMKADKGKALRRDIYNNPCYFIVRASKSKDGRLSVKRTRISLVANWCMWIMVATVGWTHRFVTFVIAIEVCAVHCWKRVQIRSSKIQEPCISKVYRQTERSNALDKFEK